MLDTVSDDEGHGSPSADPAKLAAELLRAVPRLVDRTRSQAELASHLLSQLPCLGALFVTPPEVVEHGHEARGMHETVGIDVLSLLEDDDAATSPSTNGRQPAAAPAEAPAPAATSVRSERDLPIQDYDSLAASQVVPRLATMSPEDLHAVREYELAHRNRQTILNRISQRLDG